MSAGEQAPTHFRACTRNVIQVLEKIGALTPELDARLLVSDALGLEGAAFFLHPDRLLSEAELGEVAQRLARRMAGEPVSRIIGRRGFWKHDFHLTSDVLDPRPDSETLVEVALELLKNAEKNNIIQREVLNILDLGTGSGALLISLILELPGASGTGVDISGEALEIARGNARRLGCGDRVSFRQQHWLEGFEAGHFEPFDLIVCNPPYIPSAEIDTLAPDVANFDPHLALDGGLSGLDPYIEIIPQLHRVLAPRGVAIFEIGMGQEDAVLKLFEAAGLEALGGADGCYKDLAGINRCLAATPGAPL